MTKKKTEKKHVLITVSGGIAYAVKVPRGIEVHIFDWDEYNDHTKWQEDGNEMPDVSGMPLAFQRWVRREVAEL